MKMLIPTLPLLLAVLSSPAAGTLRLESSTGAAVEITARAFLPGEMLLAEFHPSAEGQTAKLIFLGKDHDFFRVAPDGRQISLVGVDLQTMPGSFKVEASFGDASGRGEVVLKYLRILERSFKRRSIRIDERLVTAPPEFEERLARERALLAEVYASSLPEWLGAGDFIAPLPDEASANFGEHRLYNGVPRSRHTGIDISAPEGAPIRASNSGRVALAADLYYSGLTVIIDHGWSIFSLYLHCSRLDVSPGQHVRRGDIIAAVGSTGRSTGPHLHWGIRAGGARVDPISLLSLRLE